MSDTIGQHYRDDSIVQFRQTKQLAEKAMQQISDQEFFAVIDEEANSVALIVKHITGNLRSRWTDFLTTDGEKDSRNRDSEFNLAANDSRESLMQGWQDGWAVLFNALEPLRIEDFDKTIVIRGQPHTLVQAINRQLTHYSYHVGQIVFLAKHLRSTEWKTLSIPRNQSEQFRQEILKRNRGQ